jgi:lipoprotein-releasing system permease protein
MNLIKFISSRFWDTENRRFVNFARYFAISSIIIGSLALTLSLSVLEGYDRELRKNAVKFTTHINLQTFNRTVIKEYQNYIQKIMKYSNDITSVEPVIQSEGLIKNHNNVEGIFLRGVPSSYNFTSFSNDLKSGRFDIKDTNSIILGQRLADKLKVKVGDQVVLFGIKSIESLTNVKYKIKKYKVEGIFQSNMAQYDDVIAYINFQSAQSLLDLQNDEITNFEIMLDDVTKSPNIAEKLEKYLGYPFYALTVYDLHRSVFSWIELQKEPIPIVLGLITIIAAFNIITTLFILVVEKIKSIATLRALGLQKRIIVSVFVNLGISLGFFGSLIGSGISLLLSYLQQNYHLIKLNGDIYFLDILPVEIVPLYYVYVIAITLTLAFLATLIPALIAARISPIQAFRFK